MKTIMQKLITESKYVAYSFVSSIFFRNGISKKINSTLVIFPLTYSRYYPADYEPYKQKFIEENARGVCLDLGAHIGLYTVLLSKNASSVIAFEPSNFTRKVLEETLRLNKCKNVTVRSEVISDVRGSHTFHETGVRVSNANSVIPVGSPRSVNSITLDELDVQIDFLKIDIEGAELLALRGATKVLKSLKFMTLEIHPSLLELIHQDVQEIFEILAPQKPLYFFEGRLTTCEALLTIKDHFEVNIIFRGAEA
jgi:FkbM family methyltransferase